MFIWVLSSLHSYIKVKKTIDIIDLMWVPHWMNEWINEWMNELINEWMNDRMNEWICITT